MVYTLARKVKALGDSPWTPEALTAHKAKETTTSLEAHLACDITIPQMSFDTIRA
jgi:hypothetical protein